MIELARIDVDELGLLADLFEYPGGDFAALAAHTSRQLRTEMVAAEVKRFAAEIAALSPEQAEEAHVRTFLVAPASAPYVGVHLFGEESFKRALLMAQFVERFRVLGFDPGNELPDHLGVLLRFARLLDAAERADLVRWCLAQPVTAMHRSLESTRNPYRHLLAALVAAIAPDGVPDDVASALARTAQVLDPDGCNGCKVQHGGDEL